MQHNTCDSLIRSVWLQTVILMTLCNFAVAQETATIETLNAARDDGQTAEAYLLAPTSWSTAEKAYKKADSAVNSGQSADRQYRYITDALSKYAIAKTKADVAAPLLADSISMRNKAVAADAPVYAEADWNTAEKQLRSLAASIERGRVSGNEDKLAQVTAAFDRAELSALTNQLLIRARGAKALADVGDASKYATKTFAAGEQQLQMAIDTMASERYNNASAAQYASEAELQFKHATNLAITAQQLRNKDISTEDLLLQWEARLNKIIRAAGREYDPLTGWDTTSDEIADFITQLTNKETQLNSKLAEMRAYVSSLEEELRIADQKLGGTVAERDQLIRMQEEQARNRERMMQVEQMFEPTEAVVLREGNKIILRLNGLQFASGSDELNTDAVALIMKTSRAIEVYPGSTILIEGHTDATGSEALNNRLSEERANSVMRYMINELRMEGWRLTAEGFGSSRPIALNTSATGRAKNRRIDMVITPASGGSAF